MAAQSSSDNDMAHDDACFLTDNIIEEPLHIHTLNKELTWASDLDPERNAKYLLSGITGVSIAVMLIICEINTEITVYHCIAAILMFISVSFAVYFLRVLLSMKHLHYMRVKRRKAPHSVFLFLPYAFEEEEKTPMTSVSAMVGLRGSNIERFITIFFYSTFDFVLCAVLMKWTDKSSTSQSKVPLILLLISAYCVSMVATWELDIHSTFAQYMHYSIVCIAFLCAPLSFALYQHWSILSLSILSLTVVTLISWGVLMEYVQRRKFEDLDSVHKYSLFVILIEVFLVSVCYQGYVLFIFCMPNNNTWSFCV